VIFLDTSILVEVITGRLEEARTLRRVIDQGERLAVSSLVLYEWLRGPRTSDQIDLQQALVPLDAAVPFGPREARIAASLYRDVTRPRRREVDLAIAATVITYEAALWTLDAADFRDIPGLRLYTPPA
jgi:predicted nucleic acid-binding protein